MHQNKKEIGIKAVFASNQSLSLSNFVNFKPIMFLYKCITLTHAQMQNVDTEFYSLEIRTLVEDECFHQCTSPVQA